MSVSIVTILLGSGSIVFLILMMFMGARRLRSSAENKLWRAWLGVCCIGVLFFLVTPGVLEVFGVIPSSSFDCAGAVLCFLFIVRFGAWYCQRLSSLRVQNRFAGSRTVSQFPADRRMSPLNGI
jgi:hypothetical protein